MLAKRLLPGVLLLLSVMTAGAAEPEAKPIAKPNLDAWAHIPVYHDGRVMPLETYANLVKDSVCNKEKWPISINLTDYAQVEVSQAKQAVKTAETELEDAQKLLADAEASQAEDAAHQAEVAATVVKTSEAKLQAAEADLAKVVEKTKAAEGKIDWANSEYAPALAMFPEGKTQKWSSSEILLSWLSESKKWEVVPFIYCPHEKVRAMLGLVSFNDHGTRLQYVSPRQLAESEELQEYLKGLQERARSASGEFKMNDLDERVQQLVRAYSIYRFATFNPNEPLNYTEVLQPGSRSTLVKRVSEVMQLTQKKSGTNEDRSFIRLLQTFAAPEAARLTSIHPAASATMNSLENMMQLAAQVVNANTPQPGESIPRKPLTLEDARPLVLEFYQAATDLEKAISVERDQIEEFLNDSEDGQKLYDTFREFHYNTKELRRLAFECHTALYDERHGLQVTPAMNAWALSRNRDPAHASEVWFSLPTVLYSDELMEAFSPVQVKATRDAWKALTSAYVDRSADNRVEAVETAEVQLASSLRSLGEGIDQARQELVSEELSAADQDPQLLAVTAYPPYEIIHTEVTYNRLTPFLYSFALALIGLTCYSLSFGKMHRPMFWAGTLMMAICIGWTVYGFSLRVGVTGWAPVTNMYETVVFVPFIVALLGLWFLLLPLTWSGISDGWRLAAWPLNPLVNAIPAGNPVGGYLSGLKNPPLTKEQTDKMPAYSWAILGGVMSLVRLGLMAFVLWFLAFAPYADGGRSVVSLWPRQYDANGLMVWAVAFICLVGAVWFLPRMLLSLLASLVFIPWNWATSSQISKQLKETYARHPFGIASAGAAAFLFFLAAFVPLLPTDQPVLNENFSPLQPVLRSNFWLTIHVLTIVASYGAGFLAWGLGIVALFYYTAGKYRDPKVHAVSADILGGAVPQRKGPYVEQRKSGSVEEPDTDAPGFRRRPPEACSALAGYAYRAIQVAVLLLAAGTILGGLWADVSWGRFWGWDPKEVWALISFLVYVAVLHGRFAGWFNNFGLIAGTVFGATMIIMSWYGVNFALPKLADGNVGLHSYGTGAGGLEYVAGFVALNWVLLGIASARFWYETSDKVEPEQVDKPLKAEEILVEHVEAEVVEPGNKA
ncbi:cytochrome c biogenesis protein CcsA [Lignipirellula cremea]|uniref:Cytochrome c biogenesis protein CcsA n=1 Tax=Lignipirellula cremea TaxID=2528010 RepID=A0A518DPJ2_9BACT|nr:cytochrome c biogenesis protein CcsA [Lignipirellula cremea]QDU93767.1 Cytochrome c biogenesis protein CcsA [Lignipirellula cremea]